MKERPSDALWKEFGAWIREHRERNHLSQAGAAQRAGIDRQQWYRIESGKSGTRRDTVIEIARALSLNADELLERAGYAAKPDQSMIELDGIRFAPHHAEQYTPEELEELKQTIEVSYGIFKRRVEERKKSSN